jgi:hypothetical protein
MEDLDFADITTPKWRGKILRTVTKFIRHKFAAPRAISIVALRVYGDAYFERDKSGSTKTADSAVWIGLRDDLIMVRATT